MRFTTFIFRNVLRRRIRSTLTLTGMAVAVTFVVVLVGLANGLSKSMLKLYVDRGVSLIVTDKGSISPISGTLPAKLAEDIKKLPGGKDTCAGLVDFQTVEELGTEPVGIQGWPAGNYMFRELKITDGENLSDKNIDSKSVIVGSTLANVRPSVVKVGQTLTVNGTEFHIVGIFDSAEDIENGMVVMLLGDAQKVLGKVGKMTGCTVRIEDTSERNIAAISKGQLPPQMD
jgi:putative ABC transport system permease protein